MDYKVFLRKKEICKICTCGFSKKMPLCDESPRVINEKEGTNYKSLKITPEEDVSLNFSSGAWNDEQKKSFDSI
jgi:CDGSH-type Zn-finger protein